MFYRSIDIRTNPTESSADFVIGDTDNRKAGRQILEKQNIMPVPFFRGTTCHALAAWQSRPHGLRRATSPYTRAASALHKAARATARIKRQYTRVPCKKKLPRRSLRTPGQYRLLYTFGFSLASQIISTEISAGLTPEIREACPMFSGRTRFSFSRASSRSPVTAL